MKLNRNNTNATTLPVKVLQFGEGNFLRAFVDWMIQKGNDELDLNMGVAIVQPLATGLVDKLKEQDCQYHVILEGIKDGQPIRETQRIDCVMDAINPYSQYQQYQDYFLSPDLEFIISNTTEAGIVKVENEDIFAEPPASFPGKITVLLYQRYSNFKGDRSKGLSIICCELIENNASTLKKIVLELAEENKLESAFLDWIKSSCSFCNSLVDRIVTGFPKDTIHNIQAELGYEDNMVVTAEFYHLWAIEADERTKAKFPLDKAGLNVLWLDDLKAFRDKKVRILNGAHTALVPVGILAGHSTVKEAFAEKTIATFIKKMISEEVLPTIIGKNPPPRPSAPPLKKGMVADRGISIYNEQSDEIVKLQQFSDEILERFYNPYIKHYLKDISLNSLSKWITRDYPALKDSFERSGTLPKRLTFSLAALLVLYSPNNGSNFVPNDTKEHLEKIASIWDESISLSDKISTILSDVGIWGVNLNSMTGLSSVVTKYIESILADGVIAALNNLEE